MAKKKEKGGIGSLLINTVWVLIVIGASLAVFQITSSNSIEETFDKIKEKSNEYATCIPAKECGISTLFDDIKEIISDNGSGGDLLNNSEDSNLNDSKSLESNNSTLNGDFQNKPSDKDNNNEDNVINTDKDSSENEPFVNGSGLIKKEQSKEMLSTLKVVSDKEDNKKDVGYSRKEWKHWVSIEGKPCWSTRSEILYRDAVPGSIHLIDKKKEQTEDFNKACVIGIVGKDNSIETKGSGKWIDPYSGKKIEDPRDIDIDHVVPLSNAARQGGQSWTSSEKEKFANDPDNLLATSAKENRSKGEKGPGKYMPPNKSYHCEYAKIYVSLSSKYDLTITDSDKKALTKAINSCKK